MHGLETQWLHIVAAILIIVGLMGTILPILPGLPLMFCGMLLAAWADDFSEIPVWVVVILAILMLISVAVDFFASLLGAKKFGASKKALYGSAIGALFGMFFGIPGLLLGPFLGAVVGEMIDGKQWRAATKTGFGTWLGLAIGTALKLALAFCMLGIFVMALFID